MVTQQLSTTIQKLESIFDELHDFLSDDEGIRGEMAMKALHGSLWCKALYCDILNEQDEVE